MFFTRSESDGRTQRQVSDQLSSKWSSSMMCVGWGNVTSPSGKETFPGSSPPTDSRWCSTRTSLIGSTSHYYFLVLAAIVILFLQGIPIGQLGQFDQPSCMIFEWWLTTCTIACHYILEITTKTQVDDLLALLQGNKTNFGTKPMEKY